MPAAVAMVNETQKFELKTLPEGFVVLRRMTFGQIIQRRSLTKMSMILEGNKSRNLTGELAMASKDVTLFEFAHCIVEHNLEDADGRLLALSDPRDFDQLDPRVGQEVEQLISTLNNLDDEPTEQGN